MKCRSIVVCTPTRDGLLPETRSAIEELTALGAERLELAGISDIALARNLLLSRVLTHTDKPTVLLVDDDIVFTAQDVHQLVELATETGDPVSAIYATNAGTVAATRKCPGSTRWLTGLGCMALPRAKLVELTEHLPKVKALGRFDIWPFCTTGPMGGEWSSEDYTFCRRLGGVRLAPVGVAHHKRVPIRPDPETIQRLTKD